MIKGKIDQEDITLIIIHAPNIETPKYVKQLLTSLMREIYNNSRGIYHSTYING